MVKGLVYSKDIIIVQNIRIMQLFFVIYILVVIRSQITSVLLLTSNQTLTMYTNNRVQPLFDDLSRKYNCALPNIYIYEQTPAQLISDVPYSILINGTGTYNITYSTRYNNFKPDIYPIQFTNNSIITIQNRCPNPFNSYNYFDEINLFIGDLPAISYRVDCDNSFTPSVFQWGLFILIIMVTTLIFFSSYFSKSQAYGGFGITLEYKILIGVSFIILAGGILGAFFTSTINILVEVFCWIIGILAVGLCTSEILFMFSVKCLNRPLFKINSIIFKYIRPIQIISFMTGSLITCGWWFSDKNWILNDVLSCCIVVSAVQLFKFTSLKYATFYFVAFLAVQIAIGLCIKFLIGQSYSILILNNFNNPLEIQFPSITKTINMKCSWLPVTEIIFPAIFISYMRRFDKSRQTSVYIIISSISFFIGCMGWLIAAVFNQHTLPMSLFTEPALLVTVTLFATQRNEIKVIWHGRFYDLQFKDISSFQNQMRQTTRTDETKMQIELKGTILKGLRVDDMSDYQYSPKPQGIQALKVT